MAAYMKVKLGFLDCESNPLAISLQTADYPGYAVLCIQMITYTC